jgi:hypothetical protein
LLPSRQSEAKRRRCCRDSDQPAFAVDASIAEACEGDEVLARLDTAFGRYMAVPWCRCQICEPEFGDATPND